MKISIKRVIIYNRRSLRKRKCKEITTISFKKKDKGPELFPEFWKGIPSTQDHRQKRESHTCTLTVKFQSTRNKCNLNNCPRFKYKRKDKILKTRGERKRISKEVKHNMRTMASSDFSKKSPEKWKPNYWAEARESQDQFRTEVRGMRERFIQEKETHNACCLSIYLKRHLMKNWIRGRRKWSPRWVKGKVVNKPQRECFNSWVSYTEVSEKTTSS